MAPNQNDETILNQLREPINEFINASCAGRSEYEKTYLRQLPWQALDVLARRGNIAHLNKEPEISRIISQVKEMGITERFIDDSLAIALKIYNQLQIEHPDVLLRYRQGK